MVLYALLLWSLIDRINIMTLILNFQIFCSFYCCYVYWHKITSYEKVIGLAVHMFWAKFYHFVGVSSTFTSAVSWKNGVGFSLYGRDFHSDSHTCLLPTSLFSLKFWINSSLGDSFNCFPVIDMQGELFALKCDLCSKWCTNASFCIYLSIC